MAKLNIERMTLPQLVSLHDEITSAIHAARARERMEVKRQMAELAKAHGFKLDDLVGGRRSIKSIGAARYANPDDPSDTWTGKGRKPNWLLARLKKGAKIEEFEI